MHTLFRGTNMLSLIAAFAAGILAIASPCVLPIVPLIFARAGRSFRRETLPMFAGLAMMFTLVAAAGTASGHWIASADAAGRVIALALLGLVGVSLLIPALSAWLGAPLVRAGATIDARASVLSPSLGSFAIGASIGLLWAPCAGPVLGLVIAGAATNGTTVGSVGLLGAFALGTTAGLALILGASGRLLARMRQAQGTNEVARRAIGGLVLAGVVVIALGWDRSVLARFNFVQTASAEQRIADRLTIPSSAHSVTKPAGASLDEFVAASHAPPTPDEGLMPELVGGGPWINSPALTGAALRGKVVLVDFWTFECINCLNALPHVKALYAKYKDRGLVVIGVHTPELPFERVESNVRDQVKKLGVEYPVVIDGNYKIWNAFHNEYWPAAYFVDANGRIRFHHFGEGQYEDQDAVVAKLLDEAQAQAHK